MLLALLALIIGATIAILICLGQGAYLIDAAIAVLAFAGLRWEAALGILIVEYAARRVPYLARSCVHTIGVHWRLVPVLFPGAVEAKILDTSAPASPPELPRVMSGAQTAARRSYEDAERARVMTRLQIRNRRFSGRNRRNPVINETVKLQPVAPAKSVTKTEAEIIGDLLGQGLTASKVVKSLPGFNGRNYWELMARVEAVARSLENKTS